MCDNATAKFAQDDGILGHREAEVLESQMDIDGVEDINVGNLDSEAVGKQVFVELKMSDTGSVKHGEARKADEEHSADHPPTAGWSDASYTSSPPSLPPLRPEEIDRWQCHTGLQQFGENLQAAVDAVFPNSPRSRYKNIFVLMMKWKDEDPNLPVSYEIGRLFDVFEKLYGFETEIWDIPDEDCHAEMNQKILDFSKLGGNSKEDLKIVYYAGHGKLTRNRLLSFTSWRNNEKSKCPTVKWSGIQNVLEESQSDVLILLDCCNAGTANTNEGEGVTELISACAFNSRTNGVGPYSFTNALVIELQDLSRRPSFSVGELYSNIFCRIQARMPEDGRERHAAPIHLVLCNDAGYRRSIQISARPYNDPQRTETTEDFSTATANSETRQSEVSSQIESPPALSPDLNQGVHAPNPTKKVPKLAIAIRLRENFRLDALSGDNFLEWLRNMPTVAEQVKIEAGFECFSTLLILSAPISLSAYLEFDPAVIVLGPIISSNMFVPTEVDMDIETVLFTQQGSIPSGGPLPAKKTSTDLVAQSKNPGSSTSLPSISSSTTAPLQVIDPNLAPGKPKSVHWADGKPHVSSKLKRKAQSLDSLKRTAVLQDFAEHLHDGVQHIFESERVTKYTGVSCLLLSWGDGARRDPSINKLVKVLKAGYRFPVEEYKISHSTKNQTIMKEIKRFLDNDDPQILKIVYYKGPSRSRTRETLNFDWLEIQACLEQSASDVLILLDSAISEMWTSDDCNGLTEMIAACAIPKPMRQQIEHKSFTEALVDALWRLELLPSFTVNYLYQIILEEVQISADDFESPYIQPIIHQVLGKEDNEVQSIRISGGSQSMILTSDPEVLAAGTIDLPLAGQSQQIQEGSRAWLVPVQKSAKRGPKLSPVDEEPKLTFTIRVREDVIQDDFSTDLFYDWLREIPVPTDLVTFESTCVN